MTRQLFRSPCIWCLAAATGTEAPLNRVLERASDRHFGLQAQYHRGPLGPTVDAPPAPPLGIRRLAGGFGRLRSLPRHRGRMVGCLDALKERLQQFGLTLHLDNARLLEFGRAASDHRSCAGREPCGTFDLLGFTTSVARRGRTSVFSLATHQSQGSQSNPGSDQGPTLTSSTRPRPGDWALVGERDSGLAGLPRPSRTITVDSMSS